MTGLGVVVRFALLAVCAIAYVLLAGYITFVAMAGLWFITGAASSPLTFLVVGLFGVVGIVGFRWGLRWAMEP